MNILKKYGNFINEAVDTDKELKSLQDVPTEVFETSKEIAAGIFDRIRKPFFEFENGKLIFKFHVTEQDFRYIDENEPLTLDNNVRKKRMYDVTLKYLDRITETFEIQYLVTFEMPEDNDFEDVNDEDEYEDIDEYEKPDPDDLEYFDEDEADKNIKRGNIKLDDIENFEDYEDIDEGIKEIGKDVRMALGFLTPEEEAEKGLELVNKNKYKKEIYKKLLDEDPEAAEQYLIFWVNNPNGNPVWDGKEWIDKSRGSAIPH